MVVLKRRRMGLLVALAVAAGCTAPRTQAPEVDPNALGDVEFQAYLAETPLVTVDEAYRAILILADGEDTSKTFEERQQKLDSRDIARAAWKLQPNDYINKGTVAYMVYRICKMKGGINMVVFGSWGLGDRHYALRELVYNNLADDTSEYAFIRGGELISMLSKADEYMRKHKVYEGTPIELPPEPEAGQGEPAWVREANEAATQPGAEDAGSGGQAEPEPANSQPSDVGSPQPVSP